MRADKVESPAQGDKISEDYYRLFFSNSKRSGGNKVTKVDVTDDGTAYIFFADCNGQ